jgi:periplasmic protein TonB
MSIAVENKNKITAIALTIGFHALLFLLFIFIVFITPLPPFEIKPSQTPPEIELDLGTEGLGATDAGGSGQNDTHIETTPETTAPQQTHQTVAAASAPAIITDPAEETSTYIPNNPNSKTTTITETPKIEEPKEDPRLKAMLQKIKDRNNQTGKGAGGNNTGGSGDGSGHSIGDGPGDGHGDDVPGGNGKGNTYSLKGRKLMKKPDQMTDSQEEGTVVVEIIVDETGKVIKATPGQRGSTTTSSNLFAKARQAALSAKFNPSPDGIKEQRGTCSFVFVLE